MDRPWMKFHTRDWLDNKELRRCSPTSRAILADLMCLAHEGYPYGHLTDKLGSLTELFMAARCVVPIPKFRESIKELKTALRINETTDGILFIKRMVDDEAVRLKRAAGGLLGGNPNLTDDVNYEVNHTNANKVNGLPCERTGADSDSGSLLGFAAELKAQDQQSAEWFASEFWPLAWRKSDKAAARKAFKQHAKTEEKKDAIIAALKEQRDSMLAREPDHRPYMATWLNKLRYEDHEGDPPAQGNNHAPKASGRYVTSAEWDQRHGSGEESA